MREAILALAAQAPQRHHSRLHLGRAGAAITLGHYLSGYAAAFEREAQRMRETCARLNQSPLGAAALGTSSFPVDRPTALSELLGFDAPIEKLLRRQPDLADRRRRRTRGAGDFGPLTLGALIADVTAQYAQTEPWILLTEGEQTGVSSIIAAKAQS